MNRRRPSSMPRLAAPPKSRLRRALERLKGPALLRDLYADRPIGGIRTEAQARRRLGGWLFDMRDDFLLEHMKEVAGARGAAGYYRRLDLAPSPRTPRRMTLAALLDLFARKPFPDRRPHFILPAGAPLAVLGDVGWARGEDPEREPFVKPFFASRGAVTPLHYDGDYRHGLLYQVFGIKRVFLIPPQAFAALRVIGRRSLLLLRRVPAKERGPLLAALGGYEVLLEPGQAVYIPPGWWHEMHYEDTAMSISIRLGHTWAAAGLGGLMRRVHPCRTLGCLSQRWVEKATTSPGAAAELAGLLSLAERRPGDPLAVLKGVEQAIEALHADCGADHVPAQAVARLPDSRWIWDDERPPARWSARMARHYYAPLSGPARAAAD